MSENYTRILKNLFYDIEQNQELNSLIQDGFSGSTKVCGASSHAWYQDWISTNCSVDKVLYQGCPLLMIEKHYFSLRSLIESIISKPI